jgi:hypothetical protein
MSKPFAFGSGIFGVDFFGSGSPAPGASVPYYGGQTLTPNPNVFAPAGYGGDRWGANGGGQDAIGGGATDQTGYVKPIAIVPSDCELVANYLPFNETPPQSVLGLMNDTLLSGQLPESALPSGGNSAG